MSCFNLFDGPEISHGVTLQNLNGFNLSALSDSCVNGVLNLNKLELGLALAPLLSASMLNTLDLR